MDARGCVFFALFTSHHPNRNNLPSPHTGATGRGHHHDFVCCLLLVVNLSLS